MQRCTCQALLQQEHLQVDALELTPAAERPAGHTSGSATPPSAGCMDNVSTTALLVGTATHQESLLSACVSGRQRCTTPLLPRAVWGTSTSGQPGAGMPSQGRVPGSLLRSLPVTLVTAPPGRGGDRELEVGEGGAAPCRGSRGNSWLLSRASQAGRRGTALPAGSQSGALHQAAPAASNYVLSKSMGYNWTIKISLSSQLWLPQPAVS